METIIDLTPHEVVHRLEKARNLLHRYHEGLRPAKPEDAANTAKSLDAMASMIRNLYSIVD